MAKQVTFVCSTLLLLSVAGFSQEFRTGSTSRSDRSAHSSQTLAEEMRKQCASLFNQGKYREAQIKAELGLQVDPRNPMLPRIIGEAMIRLGNYKEALAIFKQQNERFKDEASFVRVGLLLAKTGQIEESRRMFTPQIVLEGFSSEVNVRALMPATGNPRQLEGAWLFLVAFSDAGSVAPKENIFYLEPASKIHPRNVLVNYSLGSAYMRKGDTQKALAAMSIAYKYSTGHLKELAGHYVNKLEDRLARSAAKG